MSLLRVAARSTSHADERKVLLDPVPLETRSRTVSWSFAAGPVAWLGASRGAAVAGLPLGEVPIRPAGGADPVWPVQGRRAARAASRESGDAPSARWPPRAVGSCRPDLARGAVAAGEPP